MPKMPRYIYIGQTAKNFKTRYEKPVQVIKNNKSRTGFSHHILNTGHAYDDIENTMEILNIQDKGTYLSTHERFQIFKCKKTGILLNENYTDTYNPTFELIL
jgi:NCAIR mutase (PurE)-related protein